MGEGDVNFMGSKRNSKYQTSWPSQQWALWQTPEPKGWKEMISRKREATRHHLCWMVHGLINTREWGGVRKQSRIEHAIRKGYGTEAKGDPWVWDGWRGWASAPEPPIVCGGLSKWNWYLHCATTHAHIHPCTTRTLNFYSPSLYLPFHLISTIPTPVSLPMTFTLKTECQKVSFSNPTPLFPMPHDHVTICYICFVQFYDFS